LVNKEEPEARSGASALPETLQCGYDVSVDGFQIIDVFQKLFSIGASTVIIVGGIVTVRLAVRGFGGRLEPKVFGELLRKDGAVYLITTTELKNVGIRRVGIAHGNPNFEGYLTALSYFSLRTIDAPAARSQDVFPSGPSALWPAFEGHNYLKAGETLSETRVFAFPALPDLIGLDLRLVVRSPAYTWTASGAATLNND